jgi:hypothetical protein
MLEEEIVVVVGYLHLLYVNHLLFLIVLKKYHIQIWMLIPIKSSSDSGEIFHPL